MIHRRRGSLALLRELLVEGEDASFRGVGVVHVADPPAAGGEVRGVGGEAVEACGGGVLEG